MPQKVGLQDTVRISCLVRASSLCQALPVCQPLHCPCPKPSDFYILEHEKVQHKPTTAKYSLFPQAPTRAELLSLGLLPIQYKRGGAE